MHSAKSNSRRAAILAAAAEVFSEMSFEQASMDVIAARVGNSKATIYRYFESKEALFTELVHQSTYTQGNSLMGMLHKSGGVNDESPDANPVDLLRLLDISKPLRETLIVFGGHVINSFHTPQSLAVQRMVIAATINSDAGDIFFRNGPAKAIDYMRKFFSVHIKAGNLRNADARVAACHYYGLLQSEIYQAGLFNVITSIDPITANLIVARAVEVFLKGYAPE